MVKPIHDNEVVKSLKIKYPYGSAFPKQKKTPQGVFFVLQ